VIHGRRAASTCVNSQSSSPAAAAATCSPSPRSRPALPRVTLRAPPLPNRRTLCHALRREPPPHLAAARLDERAQHVGRGARLVLAVDRHVGVLEEGERGAHGAGRRTRRQRRRRRRGANCGGFGGAAAATTAAAAAGALPAQAARVCAGHHAARAAAAAAAVAAAWRRAVVVAARSVAAAAGVTRAVLAAATAAAAPALPRVVVGLAALLRGHDDRIADLGGLGVRGRGGADKGSTPRAARAPSSPTAHQRAQLAPPAAADRPHLQQVLARQVVGHLGRVGRGGGEGLRHATGRAACDPGAQQACGAFGRHANRGMEGAAQGYLRRMRAKQRARARATRRRARAPPRTKLTCSHTDAGRTQSTEPPAAAAAPSIPLFGRHPAARSIDRRAAPFQTASNALLQSVGRARLAGTSLQAVSACRG
jgi:hypothetical protein